MEESNKYYQPQLEEFCEGFEFEECVDGKTWDKERSYTPNEFVRNNKFELQEWISENRIRVKLLDSQDIVDCGFIKVANDPVKQKWINALSFEGNDCRIELFPYIGGIPEQLRGIVTVFTTLNYGGCIKFHGKIKNKHELKTVLKQIGVL